MHYFIRKSFHQNQSESKDHYFLPDEDEKDNVELKESDQSISVDEPHEQILIKNFASNARVNIDIVYEDNKNIQKAQNKTSKANEN